MLTEWIERQSAEEDKPDALDALTELWGPPASPNRIEIRYMQKSTSRTRERFGKYYMYTAFSKT